MSSRFSVRSATEQDAEAVAVLSAELGYPAVPRIFRERLSRLLPRNNCLVAVAQIDNGRICGWIQAITTDLLGSGFRVEIVAMVVAGTMRRRGIGRLLVQYAEDWAAGLGAEAIVVRSNVAREESHLFYPDLGYSKIKTQHVYRKRLAP